MNVMALIARTRSIWNPEKVVFGLNRDKDLEVVGFDISVIVVYR